MISEMISKARKSKKPVISATLEMKLAILVLVSTNSKSLFVSMKNLQAANNSVKSERET